MRSDTRVPSALEALQRPISAFRSHVASARERLRTQLAADGGARAGAELGSFGIARIDVARFAELRRGVAVDALSRSRLERASAVLAEVAASSDELFVAEVPAGDSLRVVVARALARAGRAFGAAAVMDLVRAGRYEPERHDRMLDAYPFEWWSKAEREHAPPLIITVAGADLRAGCLAEYLDVGSHIVLVIQGASAPAPLVRLVTPHTLVLQARDATDLACLTAFDGPAVAGLFEEEAALFSHDPRVGAAPWQRLTIRHRPADAPKKSIGGVSPRQQREELLQLEALSAKPALPDAPVEALVPSGTGDATERLTAWLLSESGLATGAEAQP